MVQNSNNTRENKQHNSYSEVVFNRVINVLKDIKDVTHDNYLSKSDATFFSFYKTAFESITDILHKYNEIPKSYKVDNLWFDDGELGATPYFIFKAYDSNYNGIEVYSCNTWKKEVEEKCANEIANVIEQMIFAIRKEIIEIQKLPKIEELDDVFLSYINKYINSKEYKASIEDGELVEEIKGTYKAFVIRYKNTNDYKCSFRFIPDRIGNIMAIYESPYYGDYYGHTRQCDIEEHIKGMMKEFHVA